MARRPFAGTPAEYVIDPNGKPLAGRDAGNNVVVSGQAYNAVSGGTLITDLQYATGETIPGGTLVPDQFGRIPRFLGPDNVAKLWVDFGAGTTLLLATDDDSRLTTLETSGVQAAGAQYPATAVVYSSNYRGSRPATSAGQYTWTCDGVDDQAEINAAITAVNSNGGGEVLLLGGTFTITAAIQMKTLVKLQGGGIGTRIYAGSDFQTGMITLFDGLTHLTTVSDLWIDGRSKQVTGIHYNNASGQGFTNSSPDPSHTLNDLYIHSCGNSSFAGYGLRMSGANNRAGKFSNMRINSCSGGGVWVDNAVDSHYTNIEVGSSGNTSDTAYSTSATAPIGHGFFISQGDNNMFTGCKAWYSRGAGFYVRGTRNGFTNCQAQDNYSHGFHVTFGKNSFTSCHADSNGQTQTVTGDATGRGKSGFCVVSDTNTLVGCIGYDRSSNTGWTQVNGFEFNTSFSYGRVTGCLTYGNLTTSVTGTAGTGTTVDVRADSGGK